MTTKTTAKAPEVYALGGVTVRHDRVNVRLPARHVIPEVHAAAVEFQRIVGLVGEAFEERNALDAAASAARDSVGVDYAARLAAGDTASVDDDADRVLRAETRARVAQNRAQGALQAADTAFRELAAVIERELQAWRLYLATQDYPVHGRVARARRELGASLAEAVELEGLNAMLDRNEARSRGIITTELARSSVEASLALTAVDEAVSALESRRAGPAVTAVAPADDASDFDTEM
jgi:hypothetical protein